MVTRHQIVYKKLLGPSNSKLACLSWFQSLTHSLKKYLKEWGCVTLVSATPWRQPDAYVAFLGGAKGHRWHRRGDLGCSAGEMRRSFLLPGNEGRPGKDLHRLRHGLEGDHGEHWNTWLEQAEPLSPTDTLEQHHGSAHWIWRQAVGSHTASPFGRVAMAAHRPDVGCVELSFIFVWQQCCNGWILKD